MVFSADFVAVTINEAAKWPVMKPEIFASLENFFSSGMAVISDDASVSEPNQDTKILDTDDDTVAMIKELIETVWIFAASCRLLFMR